MATLCARTNQVLMDMTSSELISNLDKEISEEYKIWQNDVKNAYAEKAKLTENSATYQQEICRYII
jgi:hypothetical protein